jgi:hydrogenase maturation factor
MVERTIRDMCLIQKGTVLEVKGKTAIVNVSGMKKEVTVTEDVEVGDRINVFQTLGFKK